MVLQILTIYYAHTIIVCSYMIGHLSWELKDLPTLLAQHMLVVKGANMHCYEITATRVAVTSEAFSL